MKRLFRNLSIALAVAMLAALAAAGCAAPSKAPPAAPSAAAATEAAPAETAPAEQPVDISKKVVIKGCLLPDQPPDSAAVLQELNRKLEQDLNCTFDVMFTGWTDFTDKYALVLASGEPLDFIFTANWADYTQNAAKGAFQEVDMAMVQKFMPKSYEAIPEGFWMDCLVNGKVYMIPAAHKEVLVEGFLYREDLRKKYGAPEIKNLSDIPAFLEAVKANEPAMMPYNMGKFDFGIAHKLFMEQINGCGQFSISSGVMIFHYDVNDPDCKLWGIFDEEYVKAYKQSTAIMKDMYDKGLVPRNPYSIETRSKDLIVEGKTALAFSNSEESVDLYVQAKAKGMELKHVMGVSRGKIAGKPASTNGIAIPNSAENVERMMMAMDLIMQEESYNYLMSFGIEGKNWVITADDKLGLPEGVESNDGYPLHVAGWWFTNRNLWKPFATWDPFYIEQKKTIDSLSFAHALAGFNPILDSVKTELANCVNVQAQYENPLLIGSVEDIDAAVALLQEQYRIAGFDKVQDEVRRQVEEYLAARK